MCSRFTEHFNFDEAISFGHSESRSTLSSASESVFSSSSETLNTRLSAECINTVTTRASLKNSACTTSYISVIQNEELALPAPATKTPIKKKLKRFLTLRSKKSSCTYFLSVTIQNLILLSCSIMFDPTCEESVTFKTMTLSKGDLLFFQYETSKTKRRKAYVVIKCI
ncbi:hypothetical protein BDF20DRAFT_833879 [Mycotypha africana]|uniref:uncharacterized protein n=1 Tax=Mycotypha africana TaxID=64632 RepID=UPI002300B667|nr:uncharacterized protein BDF20DRAFT_833879 [Mycotypha africana]KAI8984366.1 hypothetical protein BDF20DRAFT_833879 [Mycotypha africana]